MNEANTKLAAIVGCYQSGASIAARLLDSMGVNMGGPYWGNYYEPIDLGAQLRKWWTEPQLTASCSAEERIHYLKEWLNQQRAFQKPLGINHPLLVLSANDLTHAWDHDIRWIWVRCPLQKAIDELNQLKWWPDAQRVQGKLIGQIESFLHNRDYLSIDINEIDNRPMKVIDDLAHYLKLTPSLEQMESARSSVTSANPNRSNQLIESSDHHLLSPIQTGKQHECIVATMLSGNNEAIAAAAATSVIDYIDKLILIDTGISDGTIDKVRMVSNGKLVVESFPWQHDFSAARNAALKFAEQHHATWVLTVDTDERIELSAFGTRQRLLDYLNSYHNVKTWMVSAKDGTYAKERFIRLPTSLEWKGRTHEAIIGATEKERMRLPGCCFWEEPKTPSEFHYKLTRDVEILQEETANNPEDGRWWYYLGQTFELLNRQDEALNAYSRCCQVDRWGEQAAWASYCASRCFIKKEKYREARAICGQGFARDASFPELAWVIAWCSYQLNEPQNAINWAMISKSIGSFQGNKVCERRVGLRFIPAWYELPFDVLRFAYSSLGLSEQANTAEIDFKEAKIARENRSH